MSAPQPAFLIPTLIRLASEERDLLASGDWESALGLREQFDSTFASLQYVIEVGKGSLDADQVAELHRIRHLNAENLALYEDFRRLAKFELGQVTKVSRIGGYAPVGPGAGRAPRYIDHSA